MTSKERLAEIERLITEELRSLPSEVMISVILGSLVFSKRLEGMDSGDNNARILLVAGATGANMLLEEKQNVNSNG